MTQGRTRLPLAIDEWDRVWADQLIRSIEQNFEDVDASIQSSPAITGYYGSFYDITNQTAAAINTPYAMKLGSTNNSNQIAVASGTQIKFKNRGIYNIQFSAQFYQSSGAAATAYVWFRKNGADIANSAFALTIQAAPYQTVSSWNFIVNVLASDYIEIMWATSSTNVSLHTSAAGAFYPAIPSVIATAVSV
jgi:hypothetical protein